MSWRDFIHSLQPRVLFQPPPKVIFINLGGNDLCALSVLRTFNMIRHGIDYLSAEFPGVSIVWVDILQRLHWSDTVEIDIMAEGK